MQWRESWWAVKEQGTGLPQFSLYQHNRFQARFSTHLMASAPSAAVSWLRSTVCPVPQYLWSCIAWHLKFGPGFIKYRSAMDGETTLKNKDPSRLVTSRLKSGLLTCQPSLLLAKPKYLQFSVVLHDNRSCCWRTTTSSGNKMACRCYIPIISLCEYKRITFNSLPRIPSGRDTAGLSQLCTVRRLQ